MSFNRKFKRAEKKSNSKDLAQLKKAADAAEILIKANVLTVYADKFKAVFRSDVWDLQQVPAKLNITANIALYVLAVNARTNPDAPMKLELFNDDMQLIAEYKNDKPQLWK